MRRFFALLLLSGLASVGVHADEIGSVNTEWKLTGSHKLVVEAFDDPKVEGVACFVAKPERGGIAGAFGVAEEVSDVSIACRQVGPIRFRKPVPHQEDAFSERRSVLFKTLHVVRMVDVKRNTLVYLTYTDKVISGSPKNSVTAVTVDHATPIPVER
ncbi:CreA family protein [Nitrogeniibacter mangrovi]|uniref:CreA family protein n=1 Tax=Nitrogeniibacter mangrovi TaxID=2016596 RepID=A0A6C1B6T2_9RHOO|nr:CreA family protein [Nitrogeniibacter mangrovi]QID18000.1 CreA family protein [Nitrogeniibacter mangrovi]